MKISAYTDSIREAYIWYPAGPNDTLRKARLLVGILETGQSVATYFVCRQSLCRSINVLTCVKKFTKELANLVCRT